MPFFGSVGAWECWNLNAYKTSTFSFQMCLTGETSKSGNLNPNLLAVQTEQQLSASQQTFDFKLLSLVYCNFNQDRTGICKPNLKTQAQSKIYEIKSWGQDSSPSYISMELLQMTWELGWGTLTQKQDTGALQNRPQQGSSVFPHSLKYFKISFSSS